MSIFPLLQLGGLTGYGNVRAQSSQLQTVNDLFDISGSKAGVTDTNTRRCEGLARTILNVSATIDLDADGSVGKSQLGHFVPGSIGINPRIWGVGRRWDMQPATGADGYDVDQKKRWIAGKSTYAGNVNGVVIAGGPDYDVKRTTLDIKVDDVGTLTGEAVIQQLNIQTPWVQGGRIPVGFNYIYDPANLPTTFTAANGSVFNDVLGSAQTEPVSGTYTVDLDTGETITEYMTLWQFRLSNRAVDGSPVRVQMAYILNQQDLATPAASASNFAATPNGVGQIDLSWDALDSSTNRQTVFRIMRRVSGVGSYVCVGTTTKTATSNSDVYPMVSGTAYQYILRAANNAGFVDSSAVAATAAS